MPWYSVIVKENKTGSKLRRKMAVEAADRDQAKKLFYDKCNPIGFAPEISTLKEITLKEYQQIIRTLLGKEK